MTGSHDHVGLFSVGCVQSSERTLRVRAGNNRGAFRRLHAPYKTSTLELEKRSIKTARNIPARIGGP